MLSTQSLKRWLGLFWNGLLPGSEMARFITVCQHLSTSSCNKNSGFSHSEQRLLCDCPQSFKSLCRYHSTSQFIGINPHKDCEKLPWVENIAWLSSPLSFGTVWIASVNEHADKYITHSLCRERQWWSHSTLKLVHVEWGLKRDARGWNRAVFVC